MIDPATEPSITLTQATKCKLLERNGRGPNVCTLWRWAQRGLRGVRLETIKIGGVTCTSEAAIRRFLAATNGTPDNPHSVPDVAQRRREIAAAERLLEEEGVLDAHAA